MIKEAIEKVIKLWEKATGENVAEKKTRIQLGKKSDFSLHEALNYLDKDSTGLLSAFKLRQAFKELTKDGYLSLQSLLDGEWDKCKDDFIKLKYNIYSDVVGDIYKSFIKSLLKNIKSFGKELTEDYIDTLDNIEDVLVKAIINFNNEYKFKHERFTNGTLKKQDAKILKKLFRFESFEEFVDSLKATNEDNFICLALCDRTFRESDGSDYDKLYDSQFAIGIKNNGAVITISDRNVLNSPSGEYKGRNPSREFFNKVDYDYLPYYKIEDIERAIENNQQLLITYKEDNINNGTYVVDLFDDVGIIYVTTLLTLAYNKYFTNLESEKLELQFFGKDIKLLPPSNSKELMVIGGKLELPIVSKDSDYTTYLEDPEDKYGIYNTGIYDWLLKEYPLSDDELKTPTKFIGTREQAQRNIWWQVRNRQREHIEKCLKEDYNRYDIEHWFKEQFENNFESIVNYIITTPEYNNIDNYELYQEEKGKPLIWKCYKDGIDMDLSSLKETGEDNYSGKRYKFNILTSRFSGNSILGKVNCFYYGGYCPALWFEDDNNQRTYELTLTLRTWGELKKFFNIAELPKNLKRWMNMLSGSYSHYAWEPYSGNRILNFTDPMNTIKIPQNEISFQIHLNISKTYYNKIKKLQKNGGKND